MQTLVSLEAAILLAFAFLAVLVAGLLRERRDRRAIERALFSEVIALRWQAAALAAEIARRHMRGEPFNATFFALWRLSEPAFYPRVGAVTLGRFFWRGDAGRVVDFYEQLADGRARLAHARAAAGFDPSPYRLLAILVRAYNGVEPWVRLLRGRYGAFLYDEPDLSEASRLIDLFEREEKEPLALAYVRFDCAYP